MADIFSDRGLNPFETQGAINDQAYARDLREVQMTPEQQQSMGLRQATRQAGAAIGESLGAPTVDPRVQQGQRFQAAVKAAQAGAKGEDGKFDEEKFLENLVDRLGAEGLGAEAATVAARLGELQRARMLAMAKMKGDSGVTIKASDVNQLVKEGRISLQQAQAIMKAQDWTAGGPSKDGYTLETLDSPGGKVLVQRGPDGKYDVLKGADQTNVNVGLPSITVNANSTTNTAGPVNTFKNVQDIAQGFNKANEGSLTTLDGARKLRTAFQVGGSEGAVTAQQAWTEVVNGEAKLSNQDYERLNVNRAIVDKITSKLNSGLFGDLTKDEKAAMGRMTQAMAEKAAQSVRRNLENDLKLADQQRLSGAERSAIYGRAQKALEGTPYALPGLGGETMAPEEPRGLRTTSQGTSTTQRGSAPAMPAPPGAPVAPLAAPAPAASAQAPVTAQDVQGLVQTIMKAKGVDAQTAQRMAYEYLQSKKMSPWQQQGGAR